MSRAKLLKLYVNLVVKNRSIDVSVEDIRLSQKQMYASVIASNYRNWLKKLVKNNSISFLMGFNFNTHLFIFFLFFEHLLLKKI